MSKRLDANGFGILVGSLVSVLLGGALIVLFLLSSPQSLWFIAIFLLPLFGVVFSTSLLWLRTRQRSVSIRRMQRGQCPKCGYDLTANTSGICPECGTPIPSETRVVEPKQSM